MYIAVYLRHGGVVNNQIKKGLLLSLSEKKLKLVSIMLLTAVSVLLCRPIDLSHCPGVVNRSLST